MCFLVGTEEREDRRLSFSNLRGPKLLAGTPSLFCIVGSVLRSDLESVLTGNQQFLRWSNGLHYDEGQWSWQERSGWGGRARKDDNRFPPSFLLTCSPLLNPVKYFKLLFPLVVMILAHTVPMFQCFNIKTYNNMCIYSLVLYFETQLWALEE